MRTYMTVKAPVGLPVGLAPFPEPDFNAPAAQFPLWGPGYGSGLGLGLGLQHNFPYGDKGLA